MKEVSDPASQLAYLINMNRDKTYEATRSCNISPSTARSIKKAFDRLSSKFGKKHEVKAHLDSIQESPIKAEEGLDKMETDMVDCCITLFIGVSFPN